MQIISEGIAYILSFKVYVMLPILMFMVCLLVGIRISNALKYAMTLGIGFLGIFMVFDFFVAKLGPAVEKLVERTGSHLTVLDVGWPPLAATAWSFSLVPLLIVVFIGVNGLMLKLKWTNTVNIDIWNFWHFIFTGQMIYFATKNPYLTVAGATLIMILSLKIGDWSAKRTEALSNIPGIAITTLTAVAYYPIAIVMDQLIAKIPVINKINGNPENIQKRLGFFGESMFIGFLMGVGLGLAAGYSIKETADLAMSIAGVVYIVPKMAGILGEGLIPISNASKVFLLKKFPHMKDARMGMDLAVIVGQPAVIVTGILVMPVAVVLALVLPGINFIPLGDLPNLIAASTLIVVACRGNIFRSVISILPIIVCKLYIASAFGGMYTQLIVDSQIEIKNFSGHITSFQDGGNLLRAFVFALFSGQMWSYILIPLVLFLLFRTYKASKKDM